MVDFKRDALHRTRKYKPSMRWVPQTCNYFNRCIWVAVGVSSKVAEGVERAFCVLAQRLQATLL